MNEQFSYPTLKQAADQAFKNGAFGEAGDLYSRILAECKMTEAVRNTIVGNRCLSNQRAGRLGIRDLGTIQSHSLLLSLPPKYVLEVSLASLSLITGSLSIFAYAS